MTVAWVVGASGLLGRSVRSAIDKRAGWSAIEVGGLPWSEPKRFNAAVRAAAAQLMREAAGGPWTIIWCAGAGVTSSASGHLQREVDQLTAALETIGTVTRAASARGAFFYASSAGGVYSGSANPPFSELTAPVPISPYGEAKLAAEAAVSAFARKTGTSALTARIANLYGPGQKLEKMQGLISQIAKAQFSTTPATIYVPLDTLRDYLYVEDCAELVLDTIDRLLAIAATEGPQQVTKILASGQAATIGNLIGCFRTIAKSAPNVMLGTSPAAALQTADLRLRSQVWTDLDRRELVSLPAGIRSTINDILSGMQASARA